MIDLPVLPVGHNSWNPALQLLHLKGIMRQSLTGEARVKLPKGVA